MCSTSGAGTLVMALEVGPVLSYAGKSLLEEKNRSELWLIMADPRPQHPRLCGRPKSARWTAPAGHSRPGGCPGHTQQKLYFETSCASPQLRNPIPDPGGQKMSQECHKNTRGRLRVDWKPPGCYHEIPGPGWCAQVRIKPIWALGGHLNPWRPHAVSNDLRINFN